MEKTEQQKDALKTEQQLIETIEALQGEIETLKQDETNLPKLYGKLVNVMEQVPYIKKDKKNDFHRYEYASEEAIKKAIHKELVKNKLLFRVTDTEIIDRKQSVNEKGKQTVLTTLKVRYLFIDAETGQSIGGSYDGEGQDPLDKGVYKALTGALKYILTSHFLIPTGSDPEDDSGENTKPDPKGKTTPKTTQAPKTTAPKGEKPWMKDQSVQDTLKKIPSADQKQIQATIAWMGAHRISNINKFALDQAIAIRQNELDGTPIPANLITDKK